MLLLVAPKDLQSIIHTFSEIRLELYWFLLFFDFLVKIKEVQFFTAYVQVSIQEWLDHHNWYDSLAILHGLFVWNCLLPAECNRMETILKTQNEYVFFMCGGDICDKWLRLNLVLLNYLLCFYFVNFYMTIVFSKEQVLVWLKRFYAFDLWFRFKF